MKFQTGGSPMLRWLGAVIFAMGALISSTAAQTRQDMQVLIQATLSNGSDYDMGRVAQAMDFSCGESKDRQHCPVKQIGEKLTDRPDDVRSINVFVEPESGNRARKFIVVLTVTQHKEHSRLFFLTSEDGTLQKVMAADQVTRKPTLPKPDEYLDQYRSEVNQ